MGITIGRPLFPCPFSVCGALRGRYWTDRDSRCELDFTSRQRQLVDSYDEAVALFSEAEAQK